MTGYDDRGLQHRYDDRGSGRYEDDRLSYVKESSSAQSAARYSDDERYKKWSRRDAEERREEGSQERISREREGRSDKDERTSPSRQKKKSSKRKLVFGCMILFTILPFSIFDEPMSIRIKMHYFLHYQLENIMSFSFILPYYHFT
mgnify:CR=1 FL=1